MASGPPPMLSDTQRSMKRTMARDGMVRKYDEIILRYANVQPFVIFLSRLLQPYHI